MSKQRTPMLFLPPKPPVALPDEGVFVIGRSRTCDLTLGSIDASRRHSEILCSPQGYRLRDLGSTNGTYLNAQRIEEQALRPCDRIEIGGDLITFCEFEAGLDFALPMGDTEAHTALVARPGAAADGLHGSLAEIPPFAVLQMLEMGRKSGVIEFDAAAGGGKLWLVDGKPVHAATEHLVERKPCRLADRVEAGAACANHDLALADTLYPDDGVDLGAPIRRCLETLDLDRDAVRQLVRQCQHQLFAQDLGGQEALGPVGYLLRRIDRFGLRQQPAGALAVSFFEADADKGLSNMGHEDLALPFLKILGQLSPEVNKRDGKYVQGAEPGMITTL